LLVIATGNITNNELLSLVDANLGEIETALDEAAFVELTSDRLIVHGRA
jgi:predicted nuclease of predicted toxin-antitoxin system